MIFVAWSYAEGCKLNGSNGMIPLVFNPEITSKDCCLLHGDETIWMILVSF